jgi:endonuclease-8
MPEGDTLYRVAHTLHRALAGQVVRRFDSAYAPLLRIDEESPLCGRTVLRVEARGKWCLLWLGPRPLDDPGPRPRPCDETLILCTHLRMNGMWHIYRPGEAWQRPARDMRVLIATDKFVAVGFRVPVAELLTASELARHRELGRLGPDLLSASFDEDEALRRLRARNDRELGPALIDQGAVAGLGNVYKSEICFLIGVHPFARVAQVSDEVLREALAIARRLLGENVHAVAAPADAVVTFTGLRRTTGAMSPASRLWVYGRAGEPCRRCGTAIVESRQGESARVTFFCPRCQLEPAAAADLSAPRAGVLVGDASR